MVSTARRRFLKGRLMVSSSHRREDTVKTPHLIGLFFDGLFEALLRCKRLKGFRSSKGCWMIYRIPALKGEAFTRVKIVAGDTLIVEPVKVE